MQHHFAVLQQLLLSHYTRRAAAGFSFHAREKQHGRAQKVAEKVIFVQQANNDIDILKLKCKSFLVDIWKISFLYLRKLEVCFQKKIDVSKTQF
jgi:hypothetical protein